MGKTDMVELKKLGRGKAELHTSHQSEPERAPAELHQHSRHAHHSSLNRTSWEGGKRSYTLLTKAKLSAPPLTPISILFSSHHSSLDT
jgi:hypothetical protein